MLSKCANPDCSAGFHYFGQGKLFEVHFEDADLCEKAGRVPFEQKMSKPIKNVEHFWLCPECSNKLTVGLDRQNNVLIMPLPKAKPALPRIQRAAAS